MWGSHARRWRPPTSDWISRAETATGVTGWCPRPVAIISYMGRLDGKIAVVTGGGNGMGLACCQRFAEEGACIVVGDVLDDAGQAAVSVVTDAGGEAIFVHLDAASAGDNETLMQAAVDSFGALDILVAAAGISTAGYRSGDLETPRRMIAEHPARRSIPPTRSSPFHWKSGTRYSPST